MELKILVLVFLYLPMQASAQFLPTTWTEKERSAQIKTDHERALEERKVVQRKAMEIKADHQKKQQLEKKSNSEN